MVEKVISGGQTGVDRIGLEIALELGIPTGGTAPLGYRTENGPDLSLRDIFGLVESPHSNYGARTEDNVIAANATLLFGEIQSSGSKLTIYLAGKHHKPFITNPNSQELRDFIEEHKVKILNVAGNRGSKLSENKLEGYKSVLRAALTPK